MTNQASLATLRILAACLLAPAATAARGAEPPITREADCRWAGRAPAIDGKLDDPAWATASVIDRFSAFWDRTDPGAAHATRARLLWDDEALYFAAEMTDAEVRSYGTRHNDHLWNGDVFELFFKPSRDRAEYFEFQVNPKSVLFESAFLGRDRPSEPFETARPLGMSAVARTEGTPDHPGDVDRSWTVEGRIPWSAFAPKVPRPTPGAEWTFALCRYDYAGPATARPVLMSSAPLTKPSFHRSEDYGRLRFLGPDPK